MKKIIVVTCLLICVVLLCASCSKEMDIAEFYQNVNIKYETTPTLTTHSALSDLNELRYRDSVGNVLVFTNDDEKEKTIFYNPETDKEILKFESKDIVDYTSIEIFYHYFLLIFESTEKDDRITYSVGLYDANGTEIATKKLGSYPEEIDASRYVSSSYDLFQFDGKIYRVSDAGGATVIIDNPFFGSFPSNLLKTTSYYYEQKSNSIVVYDHSLNQVFYWEVPYSSYDHVNISVLSEEKILAQVSNILPENEKKYDVIDDNGIKYDLTSFLIDVESGKEKTIDLDYVVEGVQYASNYVLPAEMAEYYTFSDELDNLALIFYIKDHKVYDAKNTIVSLSNKDASIKFEIAPEFDSLPSPIAPNRYMYSSNSGNDYILNEKFEIIANANGLYSSDDRNDYYIVRNNRIYNYDFHLVYDLEANDESLVRLMGESFIVSETTKDGVEYYLRTSGGSKTKIENYSTSTKQYYVTAESKKEGNYTYTFYNSNGTKLLSVTDVDEYTSVQRIYTYDDDKGYIVCLTVKGEKTYYKLSV